MNDYRRAYAEQYPDVYVVTRVENTDVGIHDVELLDWCDSLEDARETKDWYVEELDYLPRDYYFISIDIEMRDGTFINCGEYPVKGVE